MKKFFLTPTGPLQKKDSFAFMALGPNEGLPNQVGRDQRRKQVFFQVMDCRRSLSGSLVSFFATKVATQSVNLPLG